MDKKDKTREAFAGVLNVSPEIGKRFARLPALGVVAGNIQKELGKRINAEALKKTFEDLALRKTTLDAVLLDMTRGVEALLGDAFDSGKQTADAEIKLNNQYRESLIRRKMEAKPARGRRGKKEEYLVAGQLLHPETGKPVPGMAVDVVDKDIAKHDLLGVDVTDAEGRFEIAFAEKDFKESGEGLPEILIRAGMSRATMTLVTESPIALKPGTKETIEITLPPELTPAAAKIAARREQVDKKRLLQANQNLVFNKVTQSAMGEIGKAFKGSMGQIVDLFEKRLAAGGATKAKPKRPRKAQKTD
ncbi:MAG: hypothetical protein JSW39_26895 [Desulfobacterales bacterium]|nr:MAG: hypothetical protein JSW39_26895 [Desulfobacterales bacterium]